VRRFFAVLVLMLPVWANAQLAPYVCTTAIGGGSGPVYCAPVTGSTSPDDYQTAANVVCNRSFTTAANASGNGNNGHSINWCQTGIIGFHSYAAPTLLGASLSTPPSGFCVSSCDGGKTALENAYTFGGYSTPPSGAITSTTSGISTPLGVQWTPLATMGSTSQTITVQNAEYQIVGSMVFAQADITIPTVAGSSYFSLEGLPLPPVYSSCGGGGTGYTDTFTGVITICAGSPVTAWLSYNSSEWSQASNFVNGTKVHMSFHYFWQ